MLSVIFTPPDAVPGWLKWAYTAFVAVLVPVYLRIYGPTNFLFFCDVALLLTLAGLWLNSALLISMAAVGILLPQGIWIVEFAIGLLGVRTGNLVAYMFRPSLSLALRGLSLFHAWLPLLLVWLVYRMGYDWRAFPAWTVLAWVVFMACYFVTARPPAPVNRPNLPVNVNYVFGLSNRHPQRWMASWVWLLLILIGSPLIWWLTHLILQAMPPARY